MIPKNKGAFLLFGVRRWARHGPRQRVLLGMFPSRARASIVWTNLDWGRDFTHITIRLHKEDA